MKEKFNSIKTESFRKIILDFIFPCHRNDTFSVYGNLLVRLLTKKTNQYKTEEEFSNALIENYVMDFSLSKSNCGENWFYMYRFIIADNAILKDSQYDYQKTLSFIMDTIYNPYALSDSFYKEEVENAKNRLSVYIESGFKNINSYANIRMEELVDDCHYFSDSIYQHKKDIHKVTSKELYSYYKEIIGSKKPLVFAYGNIEDSFADLLKKSFGESRECSSYIPYQIRPFLPREEVNLVEETGTYNQSILKFVYKIKDYKQEDEVYFSLLRFLLSSQSTRILQEFLRDRDKLVYTASSDYNVCHGLFIIHAQIYREKYEVAKQTIFEIIKRLQDVSFLSPKIESIKERKRINLERQKDSFSSLIADFRMKYFQTGYPLNEEYEILKKITPEEFVDFVKRLKLDTIYYLEGSKDE